MATGRMAAGNEGERDLRFFFAPGRCAGRMPMNRGSVWKVFFPRRFSACIDRASIDAIERSFNRKFSPVGSVDVVGTDRYAGVSPSGEPYLCSETGSR